MSENDVLEILGAEVFDGNGFLGLLLRFAFDLLVIYVIARLIYYPRRRSKDYLFTLFLFNVIIFFVCYLLASVQLSIGFAFGLFAVFSILRYRTQAVPTKEMTYIFLSISIAVINAITTSGISIVELLFTNAAIVLFTWMLETVWVRNELKKSIIYEKIDNIRPENYQDLLEDLRRRTGLNIHRAEVGRIDFMRDIANVRVYFTPDTDTGPH